MVSIAKNRLYVHATLDEKISTAILILYLLVYEGPFSQLPLIYRPR